MQDDAQILSVQSSSSVSERENKRISSDSDYLDFLFDGTSVDGPLTRLFNKSPIPTIKSILTAKDNAIFDQTSRETKPCS